MIRPYLTCNDWTYTSVDGLIWLNNGLKLPSNLEEKACNALLKIYQEIEPEQPLIVDFRNVKDVADRALDSFFEGIQLSSREVLLIHFDHIEDQIQKASNQSYKKNYNDYTGKKNHKCRVYNYSILADDDYLLKVNELREKKITDFVKSSFIKFSTDKFLQSTPIKSSGFYDASKLLANSNAFYWISLSMADLLRTLLKNGKIELKNEVRLISVNLKASPFASVISLLLDIPLLTIDHQGPKHKVYDIDILDDLQEQRNYTYIYIGDFCIGGTEIKIAKTYARISNSILDNALVIGSYFPSNHFNPTFSLYGLVSIANLHPEAKFSI